MVCGARWATVGVLGMEDRSACLLMRPQGLPKFTCLPEQRGQHRSTMHLLPDEDNILDSITRAFDDVQAGRLPDFPTIEW